MRNVNKVIIIGNLTRDPEIRQTPNGQYIATFGIATNREWVTKEGEKNKSTEFHDAVAWSKLAEICSKYLKKGKLVYVEGYLKTRSWDTPEGFKKFKTEIVVEDMIILEKNSREAGILYPSQKAEESTKPGIVVEESKEATKEETDNKPQDESPKPEEEKKAEEPIEQPESFTPTLDINDDLKL
jgi:single-strand DNA-binding protein